MLDNLRLQRYMEEKLQIGSEVSRRYGKALFEIARENSLEQNMANDIARLLEILESNNLFKKLFNSPLLSSKKQEVLVDNIFSTTDRKKIKVNKNIFIFLKVLALNRRLKILKSSLYAFQSMVKEMKQEINVSVTTATPLDDEVINNIKKVLSDSTKKKINLVGVIDKKIIGGIILRVGSFLIDTSIRSKILKINNAIKGVN